MNRRQQNVTEEPTNNMVFTRYKLFSLILAIAVIAGLAGLARRHSVESKNRAVEIAADYGEITALASATGRQVDEVVKAFKEAGVTSVAVQELTTADLIQEGQAVITQGDDPFTTKITVYDPELRRQAAEYLRVALQTSSRAKTVTTRGADILVKGNAAYVRTLPVGLPPRSEVIRQQGVNLVARLINYPGVNQAALDHSLNALNKHGVQTVIFGGDQVLGFRGLIPEVADSFERAGLNYGAIEFSKQKGDAKLSSKLESRLVRVHSIPSAELPNLDMATAVERYVRAAKERNIRLMYVRLFDTASADPIAGNVEYFKRISRNLREEGFTIKQSHPMGEPDVPGAVSILIAAGAAAGILLLLGSVVDLKRKSQASYFVLTFVFLALLCSVPGDLGRKAASLLIAVVFPTLAVIYALQVDTGTYKGGIIIGALGRFLSATAITASGGVMIASLLASRAFMLKLDQFVGVKLAQLLPILIIAFLLAAQVAWIRDTWTAQQKRASESIRKLLSEPVMVWQITAVFAALVLVAIVLARSGNEPGVGVSGIELKFRSLMDQLLFVRPRTKEFLFGHPVMIAAIGLAMAGRKRWAIPLFILGTVGQVSAINTFCHIHTPILTSGLRVAIGAAVGSIIGVVLLWVILQISRYTKGAETK